MDEEQQTTFFISNDAVRHDDDGVWIHGGSPQVFRPLPPITWVAAVPLIAVFAATLLVRGLGATSLWMFALAVPLVALGLLWLLVKLDGQVGRLGIRLPWHTVREGPGDEDTAQEGAEQVAPAHDGAERDWVVHLTRDAVVLRGDPDETIPIGAIRGFRFQENRLSVELTAVLPDGPPSVELPGWTIDCAAELLNQLEKWRTGEDEPMSELELSWPNQAYRLEGGGPVDGALGCLVVLFSGPALWLFTVFLLGVPLVTPLGAVCVVLALASALVTALFVFTWTALVVMERMEEDLLEVWIRSDAPHPLQICGTGRRAATVYEGDLNATFDARGDGVRITRPDGRVVDIDSADPIGTTLFLRREREKRLVHGD